MKPPCLFDYATSELSQDAFFAWFLAWADKTYQGPEHDLAVLFLEIVFRKRGLSLPNDFTIEVVRQYKHIDVFCSINGDECAVLLEDKINTQQNDNQLNRYLESIIGENKFKRVIGVYCKTGDQSNYSAIEELGYIVMNRSELMKLFRDEKGRKAIEENRIIADFAMHLRSLDDLVDAFRNTPVANWDWNMWKGFYLELQKSIPDGNWDYVANPSGGFMGFWWHWRQIEDGKARVYLQLEEGKACFKVECGDVDPGELKWKWHEKIISAAKAQSVVAKKPAVMRRGYWMTVAVLDADYRVVEPDGKLDFKATLAKLLEMERLLDLAVCQDPA